MHSTSELSHQAVEIAEASAAPSEHSREVRTVRFAHWDSALAIAVLLVVGFVAYFSSKTNSITVDEIVHIPAGVSYLEMRDARMNPEHPPGMKVLAALPLVLHGVHLDYSLPRWTNTKDAPFGAAALAEFGTGAARWIQMARVPMVGVLLALGLTVFWMARRLAGTGGGFLALLIFASTPFFYAYGPLVHTDIGIALFALLAMWTFVSVWLLPDWAHATRFGVCFAGALLTKFTAGLLLPCFALFALWFTVKQNRSLRGIGKRILYTLAGVVIASVLVYLTYFCLFWNNDTASVLSYRFEHSVAPIPAMQKVALFLKAHPGLPHFLSPPIVYFLGIGHTLHALPRTTYLLGKTYPHGTPLYFPVLFLYKMPLAFLGLALLLFGLTLFFFFRLKYPSPAAVPVVSLQASGHLRGLTVLLIIFAAASLASPLNIGIRHFSVPIATLTVLLAMLVPLTARIADSRIRRTGFALLGVAVLANFVALFAAYPNFIPYFNPLIGNRPKFEVAIDSNLDWGQGLPAIEEFRVAHPGQRVAFDLKGSIPETYLNGGTPFDCENGLPTGADWAAVGATRFVSQPELAHLNQPPTPQCRNLFQFPYQILAGGAVYVFGLSDSANRPNRIAVAAH